MREAQEKHRRGIKGMLSELVERVGALEGLVAAIAVSVSADRPDAPAPDHEPQQRQPEPRTTR